MTAPDVDVAALIGYGLTLTAACDDLVADAVRLGVGPVAAVAARVRCSSWRDPATGERLGYSARYTDRTLPAAH